MILDEQGMFSNNQPITKTCVSENVLDMGNREVSFGTPVELFIQIAEDFNNLTSLTIKVQTSKDEEFSDPVDLIEQIMKLVELKKGAEASIKFLPKGNLGYMRLNYEVDGENPTHIIPRNSLKTSDAADIWWVGDRADGGFVAVCLKRALSTSGFSLQTTKSGKGNTSVTLTGHVSVATQNEVPMEFYSIGPTLGKLTVTSSEGSTTGMTKLSVTEKLNPGNKFVYKLGEAAEAVEYGDDLKEWKDLVIGGDINAETHTHGTVAEVDAESKAVAVGSCELQKKAGG